MLIGLREAEQMLSKLKRKKPPASETVTITVEEAAVRLRIGRNQAYEADMPA